MNSTDHQHLILVLGMHRSGTSAITRGLMALGVELGQDLMQAAPGINDKGFWEDTAFNQINIEVMDTLGQEWHSLSLVTPDQWQNPSLDTLRLAGANLLRERLAANPCFGIKDPRTVLTLPFWQGIIEHLGVKASYVIACRNPASVAHSLAKRDGFALEKGHFLWQAHMLHALKGTQMAPRVFVDFDQMLKNPTGQLGRIGARLGLEFDPSSEAILDYQGEFLDASLRHHGYALNDLSLDPSAPQSVLDLSQLLFSLTADARPDNASIHDETEALYRETLKQRQSFRLMRHYDDSCRRLSAQLAASQAGLADLSQDLAQRKSEITDLAKSIAQRDDLVARLQQAASDQDRRLNALIQTNENLSQAVQALQHRLFEQDEDRLGLCRTLEERDAAMDRLVKSRSWQITKPLRWIGRIVRGDLRVAIEPLKRLRGFWRR